MSTYANYQIKTRDELKKWILTMLGEPLITVELTNEQIDFCINNALEIYTKYSLQDEKYLARSLDNYEQDIGLKLPDEVTEVFSLGGGNSFANTGLLNSVHVDMYSIFSLKEGWVTYELTLRYLEMVQKMLATAYQFEYNPRSKYLTLYPDPKRRNITNSWIVIGCKCIRPEEQLYGEEWVKKYALAECKILLGTVRKKFTGTQLLGGGTVDESIYDQGIQERDALIEELQAKESGIFGFYVG